MSLLPPNASPLERALEAAVQVPALPAVVRDLWNPDTCPIDLLPWLAWGLSIDTWSPEWPEQVKRDRVREAIRIQRVKGTLGAIKRIVSVFGAQASIIEWWQTTPKGEPHTFEILLTVGGNGPPVTSDYIDTIIEEVRRAKPLRSHFTFIQGLHALGEIGLIAVARPALHLRLRASVPVGVVIDPPPVGFNFITYLGAQVLYQSDPVTQEMP